MIELRRLVLVLICCVACAGSAVSAFKTSKIGAGRNLIQTPVVDLISSLSAKLSDSNASITSKNLKDIGLNVSAFGGYPLSAHDLSFIKHMLTGVDIGASNGSFQTAFDAKISDNATACPSAACSRAAADWVHEQVSDDNTSSSYGQWNLITAELLDDLIEIPGYTTSVLKGNNASISTIQNDVFFRSIANLEGASSFPSSAEIKNRINHAGGFVTAAADGATVTTAHYTTAQSIATAYRANTDYSNFTAANFTACYNNDQTTQSGGANTCSVTSSAWAAEQAIITAFNGLKSDLADNNTLTVAQLQSVGLDVTSIGSPAADWQLEYLSSALDQSASLVSAWQTTINSFDNQTGALWKVGQVAAGASGHPDSDITSTLLNTAIGSSFDAAPVFTAGSSTSASGFAGDAVFDNLTDPNNTASNVKANLLSYVGFTDAQYTAWNGNAHKTTFTVSNFNNCYNSSDSLTGNANTCSISNTEWTNLNTLLTSVTDNVTASVTKSAIDNVYAIDNSSYSLDLTDSVNLEYVQDCMFDLSSVNSGTVKSCIGSATAQVAAKWKIYQISLGTDNATHPLTDLTVTLYDRAVNAGSSGFLSDILAARPSYSITNLRSDLSTYFSTNSITDQSNDDAFKLFPVSKVGFRDTLTSYNSWIGNSGFSVSTVDNASEDIVRVWEACRRSKDSVSGGSGTCSPSYSTWAARAADRASLYISQVNWNDGAHRIYTETLMGVKHYFHQEATKQVTQYQYESDAGTTLTKTIGWISHSSNYAFFNQSTSLAETPSVGTQLHRQ